MNTEYTKACLCGESDIHVGGVEIEIKDGLPNCKHCKRPFTKEGEPTFQRIDIAERKRIEQFKWASPLLLTPLGPSLIFLAIFCIMDFGLSIFSVLINGLMLISGVIVTRFSILIIKAYLKSIKEIEGMYDE